MLKYLLYCCCVVFICGKAYGSDDVARVIYSEASAKCSNDERFLVASVIKNRTTHPAFKLGTMDKVIHQRNAFQSYSHKNSNWNVTDNKAYKNALELSKGTFKAESDIVFFHDKSIRCPWKNVRLAKITKHFKFYAVK